MAAKIEEIYPPYVKFFSEATNDTVSIEEINLFETKIGECLNWNFDSFTTLFEWTSWFMQRWDDYVDSSLSYLKHQFQLKFYEEGSYSKYATLMNFVDVLSLDYDAKLEWKQRMVVASVMYLIIGGKDIMCAF